MKRKLRLRLWVYEFLGALAVASLMLLIFYLMFLGPM